MLRVADSSNRRVYPPSCEYDGYDGKVAIVVLGMHRSGTSAMAGVLHHLGVNMGKLLLEANKYNKKGYYENKNIVDFNRSKLLPKLNMTCTDLNLPSSDSIEALTADKNMISAAMDVIRQDYEHSVVFGMKDPRLCLLFPFWDKVLCEMGCAVKVIIMYRNPLEVALSLLNRDKIPVVYGVVLWARYMLSAEYFTRSTSRLFVNYDDVIKRTKYAIGKIQRYLRPNVELNMRNVSLVESFVDYKLKHFRVDNISKAYGGYQWLKVLNGIILSLTKASTNCSIKTLEIIDAVRGQYEKHKPVLDRAFPSMASLIL
ncbi:sulfotransferase family protein [Thermodesulforhabdus norvegica]|uniref:Sulfotransferase family protein n=1 Tax=Thermodesulforhabdus norvegica TaxID=39841 RepID=A0A1I4TE13_9BACT|nr:hypothetical protein [Thermodesulforhabdus norvegica]SFM74881.1 hypothetical protein SAMN05660836_01363 [Thermodesulforhabdus norvegica]